MHSIESGCYRTGKYTVCRHVRASFSPEIGQAGAVTGLNLAFPQVSKLRNQPSMSTTTIAVTRGQLKGVCLVFGKLHLLEMGGYDLSSEPVKGILRFIQSYGNMDRK